MNINDFIRNFSELFPFSGNDLPWVALQALEENLSKRLTFLGKDYSITGNIAIHQTARIEEHVIIKGPAIISADCFIAAHAYLRGGVFLAEKVSIGPGTEIKTSVIGGQSALAHFNFVGDSVIGERVNMEAGSLIANHYNERRDKTIRVLIQGRPVVIDSVKFGALVGDDCKIGANAVLSPGTLLTPGSVVARLQLVDQCPPSSY